MTTRVIGGMEYRILRVTDQTPPGFEPLSDLEAKWVLGKGGEVVRGQRLVRRMQQRIAVHYEPQEKDEVDLASLITAPEELHWIEIEILGNDDQPLVNTACVIEFPGGRTRSYTTDQFGRVRVEDLPKDGDCWVTLPKVDADAWDQGSVKETKIEEKPWNWIALVLVDQDDHPVPEIECVVELPDGQKRELVSDRAGRIWVEGIESADDCTVSFPKLDGDAWEVADG